MDCGLTLVATSGPVVDGEARNLHQRKLAEKAKAGDQRSLTLLLIELEPMFAGASWVLFKRDRSSAYEVSDLIQEMSLAFVISLKKSTSSPIGYGFASGKGAARDFMAANQPVYISNHARRKYIETRNELQKEKSGEPSMQEISERSGLALDIVVSASNALTPVGHLDFFDQSANAQLAEEIDDEYEVVEWRLALLLPLERAFADRCLLGDTKLPAFQREYGLTVSERERMTRATLRVLKASFGDSDQDQRLVMEARIRTGQIDLDQADLTEKQRNILREVVFKQQTCQVVADELGINVNTVVQSKIDATRKLLKATAIQEQSAR